MFFPFKKKPLEEHKISVRNAFNGLKWAFRTQPNFKIHFFLSFLSLIGAVGLRVSYYEFLIIILLIFLGLTLEIVNTAIEKTTDAIDRRWREDIGLAKDISAGAMFLFACGAAIIATIIFLPRLIVLI